LEKAIAGSAAGQGDVPGGFGAQPRTGYRPDIDGLRAVAVIPVVLFHSGVSLFSGGFVGVDVFFVISGYLITQILYREAKEQRFSIARFYARRIRRIFPALFFVLLGTLAAGLWILLPDELSALARSVIATAIFCSNLLFWNETGYFATEAIYKPLLHTWSLAVEEQFYIFFPLGLWLVHRFRDRALLPVLILVTVLSFALNVAIVDKAPVATFYMLPTRAWELLAGAIIAVAPLRAGSAIRQFIAAVGLAAILLAVLILGEGMPFPGFGALLPVIGTAMVIASAEGTATGRLLSLPPLRMIGLISYSLYLWHWPILTFARFTFGTQLTTGVTVACVALSLLIAWVSWRFVEAPFRKSGPPGPAIATGVSAITAGVAIAVLLLPGLPSRLPAKAIALASVGRAPAVVPACFVADGPNPDLRSCIGGDVVLIGDSHALQFYSPAHELLRGIHLVGRGGCLPILGVKFLRFGKLDPLCDQFNREAFSHIAADKSVKTVVLAGRWARLTFPPADPEAQKASGDVGHGLRDSVAMLHAAGKRVVLIGSVPEFKEALPECLARAEWRSLRSDVCQHNPFTVGNRTVAGWLNSAGADALIWPDQALCNGLDCITFVKGQPVSWDRDHLTPTAAKLVLERTGFIRAVRR
jgi:peptidoglycan/LPS O-acetylase OafA/YrhL